MILSVQTSLESLRDNYEKGYEDEDFLTEEIQRLEGKQKSVEEEGYLGAMQMLMAKHHWNPIRKLSYFNEGKGTLDAAIEQNPKNIELRYLRLINQLETPDILGYKSSIVKDKQMLMKGFSTLDSDLKQRISKYVLESEDFTKQEKLALND